MSVVRSPNRGLARLMEEADWTSGQLARAVNRAGQETGLALHYGPSAVSHWLGGTVPRAAVRPVLLEALARRLSRPVTGSEAGFPADDLQSDDRADTVTALMDVGRADMDPSRRGVLTTGMYSAALLVPAYTEMAGRLDASHTGRTTRTGAGEVTTVRTMTERIADILDELGAGHARPMAAAFLVNTVGPYLHARAVETVRRDMLAAASDLVYLTGWMAMYETEHGLGQRYYVKALELAGAAEDHTTYCRTLRGMALQAASLGHGRKALELADAAAEAAPSSGPRLRAFLAGQQAHGAALVGDRRQAFARLGETETALSKADDRRDAIGGYDRAAYEFHLSAVLYAFGDVPGSVQAMQASNRVRPPQDRQGSAHAHGLLAQRQWELGHVEAACETWNRFLDSYEGLSSRRADEHFRILRRRIRPYLRNRHAHALYERARETAYRKAA